MASVLVRVARTRLGVVPTAPLFRAFVLARPSLAPSVKINPNHVVLGTSRRQSTLAASIRPLPHTTTHAEDVADKKPDLPHFNTLEGCVTPELLQAITKGSTPFTHMSPVQAAILPLLPGLADLYDPSAPESETRLDLLVKAKTGTGKTLAFLLPAIEARLKAIEAHGEKAVADAGETSDRNLKARAMRAFARRHAGTLIISPTRELATQIAVEAQRLTRHLHGFEVRLFVGGESKREQMREWMRGRRDILVATPGRLRDFLSSEPDVADGLSKVQLLILDEADTLLDMGFRPDITDIESYLPPTPERQTFLFSATVSKAIQDIARSTLSRNHQFVNCVPVDDSPVHEHVPQYHTVLHDAGQHLPHILRLLAHDQLANPGASKTIVFCPTYKMTQLYAKAIGDLASSCLPAGRFTRVFEIHSRCSMAARTRTSQNFRTNTSGATILVSSDVSARGIDYPNVTRVIQVGVPAGTDQYIHRVGRTGRAGTSGRGDLVLLPFEMQFVSTALSDVPIKPLTSGDLASETLGLAQNFDKDPRAFFADVPRTIHQPRQGFKHHVPAGPSMFAGPVAERLQNIEQNVTEFAGQLDEQAVEETFVSLLGFYASRIAELRTSGRAIVDACKSWAVDTCGLPIPPFVSESFLRKVGLTQPRESMRNVPFRGDRRSSDRSQWANRTSDRSQWQNRTSDRSQWEDRTSDGSQWENRTSDRSQWGNRTSDRSRREERKPEKRRSGQARWVKRGYQGSRSNQW